MGFWGFWQWLAPGKQVGAQADFQADVVGETVHLVPGREVRLRLVLQRRAVATLGHARPQDERRGGGGLGGVGFASTCCMITAIERYAVDATF